VTSHRIRAVAIVGALAGAALFVWTLRVAGLSAVVSAVERLGAGFAVIVALGGVRHLVRATAWRLCFEDPRELPLGWSVAAYISGDAVGNVTPFGIFASEPSKIVLLRNRLATTTAIPALALENLFYGATVVVMLVAGTAALLLAFNVTAQVKTISLLLIVGVVAALTAAALVAKLRPQWVTPLAHFVARHRGRLWAIAALEIAYHASAVLEIWIALALITGTAPTLLVAFVLEYVNRAITVAFQFVPMWLGVDEAGTGLMTTALGLTGATGVALALARKARVAVWTVVGLVLVAVFRRRRELGPEQDEDRYRWRDGVSGASAGDSARR
jgi:lysylphosphatidylglycerol synthase-like protein